MNALLSDSDPAADWERLRPTIDDAIQELGERDREAVLLRFFENRPFAEIGAVLRVSEDAARMRVERALDRLRSAFARRGVTSTGAALATILAQQTTGMAAPAGLAGAVTSAALAGAGAGVGGAASVAGTGILFMSKTTTTLLIGAILVAGGTALYQWTRAQQAEIELAALRTERDGLHAQVAAEQERSRRAAQETAMLQAKIDTLQTQPAAPATVTPATPPGASMPSLAQITPSESARFVRASQDQAIHRNLSALAAARDRFQQEHGHPPASLDDLVGKDKPLRALVPVNGEDYSAMPLASGQSFAVIDRDGVRQTYDPAVPWTPPPEDSAMLQRVREAGEKLKPAIAQALQAYRAANGGAMPTNPSVLLPYFSTPQESGDYANLLSLTGAMRGN